MNRHVTQDRDFIRDAELLGSHVPSYHSSRSQYGSSDSDVSDHCSVTNQFVHVQDVSLHKSLRPDDQTPGGGEATFEISIDAEVREARKERRRKQEERKKMSRNFWKTDQHEGVGSQRN